MQNTHLNSDFIYFALNGLLIMYFKICIFCLKLHLFFNLFWFQFYIYFVKHLNTPKHEYTTHIEFDGH